MSDPQQPSEPHSAAHDGSIQPEPMVGGQQPAYPVPAYPVQPAPGADEYQAGQQASGVPPQPYGAPPHQTYPGYAQPAYPPAQGYGQPQAPGYPPAQGYGQPVAGYAPQPRYPAPQQPASTVDGPPSNNPALWSMILGAISAASLLSLLIPFFGFFIVIMTFPLSICSVALGYAGLSKAKRTGGVGRTNAIVGMILGHIVLLFAIAVGVFLLMALIAAMSSGSFG
ncbi:hypothetical protein QE374_000427 [Microbacterium sp. SORGH_AS428]|uniref:DUF4190 domain-containing protein n=1 Tax=Microbacterium sp. SORGH_AS_0428 TaxID=3041788 RepID=UPI0028663E45|nr:hypothetical protein [Microbacterium sp. SORGH_AS_0428]MDR6198518.1 hypothetical protein [Microbacterium sp. SORGH_AS_0428]